MKPNRADANSAILQDKNKARSTQGLWLSQRPGSNLFGNQREGLGQRKPALSEERSGPGGCDLKGSDVTHTGQRRRPALLAGTQGSDVRYFSNNLFPVQTN